MYLFLLFENGLRLLALFPSPLSNLIPAISLRTLSISASRRRVWRKFTENQGFSASLEIFILPSLWRGRSARITGKGGWVDWFAHLWIARSQKPAFVKYLTKRVVTCVTFGSLFIFLLQRHSFPYNFYSVLVWVVWFLCGSSGRSFGMFNSSGPTKKKGWWPERLVCIGLGSGESCSGDRSRKVSHMVLSRHKMHIPAPLPHMHLGPWVSSECTLGIWLYWAHSKILC